MRGDVAMIVVGAVIIFGLLTFSLAKTASLGSREEERREMEELIGRMDQKEGK